MTDKVKDKPGAVSVTVILSPCLLCAAPARGVRALYCAPCRAELHRQTSRAYRRSPRGKLKMAAWLAAHPGYTREQCRVWRERHRTVKFTRCLTLLCGGVFVRPRRSARMFCDDCRAVFWPSRYRGAA